MSRFIRTKDRIVKVETIADIQTKVIFKDNFVAQSKNLEELCDGFYIDEGNEFSFYEEDVYEDFEEAKEVFKKEFDDTSTLYGFIKTQRGLIYVAKMNEKGELELI